LIGSTDTSIEIARTERRLLVIEEKGMSQDIEPQVKPEPENPRRLAQIESPTTVREIMTADVVTVTPHQSLADAMALMATHRFHHLLVTNADGKLLGVLSDRDLLSALPGKPDWENYEVRQMMTKNPLAASPDDSLADALSKVLAMRVNSLPVIAADGKVLGIVTSTDLLRHLQLMVQSMQRKLRHVGFIEFSL
jgi:CBS domain-containing protein